jgi:hypothetical protein
VDIVRTAAEIYGDQLTSNVVLPTGMVVGVNDFVNAGGNSGGGTAFAGAADTTKPAAATQSAASTIRIDLMSLPPFALPWSIRHVA